MSARDGGAQKEAFRDYFDVKADRLIPHDDDDRVVAFWDRAPRAAAHVLVVPRYEFLVGVEDLAPRHLELLALMERVARRVTPVGDADAELVLGFHRKPLRSVPFLHLHSIRPPFNSVKDRLAFSKLPLRDRGFVSLSDVVRRLRETPNKQ